MHQPQVKSARSFTAYWDECGNDIVYVVNLNNKWMRTWTKKFPKFESEVTRLEHFVRNQGVQLKQSLVWVSKWNILVV